MDDRDSDSADFSVVRDRRSTISPDSAKLVTAAALGAAFGAGVAYFLIGDRASGDEAPIRVKGGSIDFELLSNCASWAEVDESDFIKKFRTVKKWGPKKGKKASEDYWIILTLRDPAGNTYSSARKGTIIAFYYDQMNAIEVQANGRKTRLTPHGALKPKVGEPRFLTQSSPLARIDVDGFTVYPLNDGTNSTFDNMLLLDYCTDLP